MTDTVYDPATEGLPRFSIRETRDRRALDAALSDDRAYSAYALGHMERELFLRARFWLAEGPTGNALVSHAGAMGQMLFVGGDATAIDAVLSLHPGPRFTYVTTAAPEHMVGTTATRVRNRCPLLPELRRKDADPGRDYGSSGGTEHLEVPQTPCPGTAASGGGRV